MELCRTSRAKFIQPVARRAGATRAEQIMCYRERVRRVKRRDECVTGGPDAVKTRFGMQRGTLRRTASASW